MKPFELHDTENDHSPYVTITHGMRGYFCVLMHWNTELDGFWEPWNSGFGSYRTSEEAIPEATDWARAKKSKRLWRQNETSAQPTHNRNKKNSRN